MRPRLASSSAARLSKEKRKYPVSFIEIFNLPVISHRKELNYNLKMTLTYPAQNESYLIKIQSKVLTTGPANP